MKNTPKARMAKRRDRFVIGYLAASNTVYGRKYSTGPGHPCTDPLTRRQADKILANMPYGGCAIFELVPVAVNR